MGANLLSHSTDVPRGWSKYWGTQSVAFFGALLILQANPSGKGFSAARFQSGNKTGSIEEAIDAAAEVRGGTVQIPAGTLVLHAAASLWTRILGLDSLEQGGGLRAGWSYE